MLKKKITFEDPFLGMLTQEFYFNFTKAELLEMKWAYDGNTGLEDKLREIMKADNNQRILEVFKDIVAKAYGEKVNGRFVKSKEASDAFLVSEAWSQMFLELLEDDTADKMSTFINSIVPQDLTVAVGQTGNKTTVELPKEDATPPMPKLPPEAVARLETAAFGEQKLPRGTVTPLGLPADNGGPQTVDLNTLTPSQLEEYLSKLRK